MLVSFVLMFQKDYVRDWKDYQTQFAAMEFEKLLYDMNELEKKELTSDADLKRTDAQIDALVKFLTGGKKR